MSAKSRDTIRASPSKDTSKATAHHIHREWSTGPGKTESDTFDVKPDQAITIYNDGRRRGPHIRYDNISDVPASGPAGELDFKNARPDWGVNGHGTKFTLVTEKGKIPLETGSVFTTDANTQVDTRMLGAPSNPDDDGDKNLQPIGTSALDKSKIEDDRQALELEGTSFSWTVNDEGKESEWEERKLGPNEMIRVYNHPQSGRILVRAPASNPSIEGALKLKLEPGRRSTHLSAHDKLRISTPRRDRTFGPLSTIALFTDANTNVTYKAFVLKPSTKASSVDPPPADDCSEPLPTSRRRMTTLGSVRPPYLGSYELLSAPVAESQGSEDQQRSNRYGGR
jgi:hypothetical protein